MGGRGWDGLKLFGGLTGFFLFVMHFYSTCTHAKGQVALQLSGRGKEVQKGKVSEQINKVQKAHGKGLQVDKDIATSEDRI